MTILIATSEFDFDPTEVAVPWKIFRDNGQDVVFATESGRINSGDQRMLDGNKFGILKNLLIAEKPAQSAYRTMLADADFQKPIRFDEVDVSKYTALYLPGGHAERVKPFLESRVLQSVITGFFTMDKPVGAICHGVVAACRAIDPITGKSVLFGRKTTALLRRQERLAYRLTRGKLGDYYLTYPETVEDEVTNALQSPSDFIRGPLPLFRDSPEKLDRGFTVRDGNYLSARWPGDAHRFAAEFLRMVEAAE